MSSAIFGIAKNEFSRCIGHPLVIGLTIFLCILALIVVSGNYMSIQKSQQEPIDSNVLFLDITSSSIYWISSILSFLSLSIGVVSMAGERSSGSIRVLLSKPVYRMEIIMGKFIGINSLILLLILFVISICIALSLIAFGLPSAFPEDILRVLSLAFLLFLLCAIFTNIVLLCGVLFKDIYTSLILSTSLYLIWFISWPYIWTDFLKLINPVLLYLILIRDYSNTHISYLNWVSSILPYITYMLLEILAIFLINCYIFTREEI